MVQKFTRTLLGNLLGFNSLRRHLELSSSSTVNYIAYNCELLCIIIVSLLLLDQYKRRSNLSKCKMGDGDILEFNVEFVRPR